MVYHVLNRGDGRERKGDITDIQTELTHSIERLDSAKRKEFPVSAGRNGVKTAPMRKPPTLVRIGREATPATCDSERCVDGRRACDAGRMADGDLRVCAVQVEMVPRCIGYDRSGRLSTVEQAAGMGPATSFQCVRNGRPKCLPPAKLGPRPPCRKAAIPAAQIRQTRSFPFCASEEVPAAEAEEGRAAAGVPALAGWPLKTPAKAGTTSTTAG